MSVMTRVHLGMHRIVVQQRPQLLRQAVHLDIHNSKLIQSIRPAPVCKVEEETAH